METKLEDLVKEAKNGNRDALESLVRSIQDQVYRLALRMLGYPADAEDAAQEILIKVVTRLDSYRGESKFTTWVYRVAANHLLTTRKRLAERQAMSFEEHEAWVEREFSAYRPGTNPEIDWELIKLEVRLLCIQGILLCLDRPHRITYILSDVFDISSRQGAYVLDINPAAYRKRLSRARDRIMTFMLKHCGFIKTENRCRCDRVAPVAVQTDMIDVENLIFAQHPCRSQKSVLSLEHLKELDALQRVAALFKSHPDYAAPDRYLENLKELINGGQVRFFQ